MNRKNLFLSAVSAAFILLLCGASCEKGKKLPPEVVEVKPAGPVFEADSALAFCYAQCAFGPRTMNSEAHERCGEWIAKKFEEYGCTVELQNAALKGYDGTTLKATNIIARHHPERQRHILICAHWDSRPWADNDPDSANWRKPVDAANDGASGVAVMIEMARLLKNADSLKNALLQRVDLPESWAKDALSDSLAHQDSLLSAASDLHLEDFQVYGYRPNTPVVVIDACLCGSFHKDDCIANEYIFQPGGTIAVLANTVNSLQDKWSDRFIGLLNQGGCVGDMARFSTSLESHVIGDPTYRFTALQGSADVDHLVSFGTVDDWRQQLEKGTPELRCLAIDQLQQRGAISSAELLRLYEESPYVLVRLQAMRSIVDCRDDNTIRLLQLASQDANELIQRFSIKYIAQSGDDRLIPALITLSVANNTSDRCTFDAGQAMQSFPKEKLLAEFVRQFDMPAIQYIRKDSVRSVIEKAISYNAGKIAGDLAKSLEPGSDIKERRSNVRATRNIAVHHLVPQMLDYIQQPKVDEESQLLIIEALGWHPLSYQAPLIGETMQKIVNEKKKKRYSQAVRAEALKTYNRLNAK